MEAVLNPDAVGLNAGKQIRLSIMRALQLELLTYPKPGLVSLVDSGSHADMCATTFIRSSLALRNYIFQAAQAGVRKADFDVLKDLALLAEARMLKATQGVNTHRGAIFNLGLLGAAAGLKTAWRSELSLGQIVSQQWGESIRRHRGNAASHGHIAAQLYGVGGAQAEASGGFPSVYRMGLPAYRLAIHAGKSAHEARVHCFFTLMSELDDTNLLHRGGSAGLAFGRQSAKAFLHAGGVFRAHWLEHACALHQEFVRRNLSPGGSADLLSACIFIVEQERLSA